MSHFVRLFAHAPAPTRAAVVVLLVCAWCACAADAAAQTYIVDNQHPGASTSGPGTESQPYSTILSAVTARKGPGVTILVNPGSYPEQISVPASGNAAAPYVIRASGPGVVLEGADDLSGEDEWDEVDGGVYLADDVGWSPKQVFLDGVRLLLSTATPDSLPVGSFVHVSGEGLFVNLGGANPGAHTVLVSRRNNGFTLSSRSFVRIEGFEIVRTNDRGINMHSCTDLVIADNVVRFAGSSGIHANNSQRVVIEGNVANDTEMHGIALTAGTSACTVRGNEGARNAHPTIRLSNGLYLFGAPGNVLEANDLHHNQDSGVNLGAGSDSCLMFNNRSWANGDHGFDHLQASGTVHYHDVAYGNLRDGFSFEGNSVNSRLFNSIAVENGLTTNQYDLWVEANSLAGFVSDHNLFWKSTSQTIIRIGTTFHTTLATHQASGLDLHSIQADPRFTDPAQGDFTLAAGSPAVDAATSEGAGWPATDAVGRTRSDDPHVPNTGAGAIAYADLGAYERLAFDTAPLVTSPSVARVSSGSAVSFTVSVSDPDGDPIEGLVMVPVWMPAGHGAVFTPDPDNTGGTFTWEAGAFPPGNYLVEFVATNALSGSSKTPIQLLPPFERPQPPLTDEPPPDPSIPVDGAEPDATPGTLAFPHVLAAAAEAEWGIYDLQGRELRSETRSVPAGRLRVRWDGLDRNGVRAPGGIYFARVRVGGVQYVRRIVHY